MRIIVISTILTTLAVRAELVESTIEWRPACDGATIEMVTDGAMIRSARAYAMHSFVIREWTIHYVEGIAVTAEYKERTRGKIMEGELAGEDSGENPLKRLSTFKALDGVFNIADKELSDDLADVLSKAKH